MTPDSRYYDRRVGRMVFDMDWLPFLNKAPRSHVACYGDLETCRIEAEAYQPDAVLQMQRFAAFKAFRRLTK